MFIDIMNDHGLEQLLHFPTREKNTLDLKKKEREKKRKNLGGRCIYITKEILSR